MLIVPNAQGQENKDDEGAPSLPPPPEEEKTPEQRIQELEQRMEELEQKIHDQDEANLKSSPLQIHGYVDFGFFAPNGNNGVGYVRDFGNQIFPQYSEFSWTFYGDILATTINSRGEVADLGDAPGITRFDSVNSDGGLGFIVNEVNFRIDYQIIENMVVRSSINFVPRSAAVDFSLGDFFDIDTAELEYVITKDGNTSIFAGKTMPVFGIEYRERRADQRFGVTPSLVQRYTSGSQLGLKIRSKLFHDWLILAASVTNNSSTTEQFHFYSEIDKNYGKTLNGRIAVNFPIGDFITALLGDTLEVGFSAEWGPQDKATDNDGAMWFIGVDLAYSSADFALKAQWMRGAAPGKPSERVWSLDLHDSGYVELDWMVLSMAGLIIRGELRDAVVKLSNERIYLTKEARITAGVRLVLNPHMALKAEYLHNRELGSIPEFKNDIFTSSLVLSY